ncbi:very short patch repair endonuclease [Paenibacillus sp. FSL W8-1287]|uniref:very short patch repair endonuclease n=1 Tax=Paenibacillus sp. FSL W8-1287 TaxID=2954653 RepID=UPI0030CA74AF
MVDKLSPSDRSKNMSKIKGSHTKLEDMVTKELWARGFRFRKNVRKLEGKPDIAIKKYKIVIFIDSCFWHFCDIHGHIPKSKIDFWTTKLERNKQRDVEVTSHYLSKNWNILRVWEHELKNDFENTILKISDFINQFSQKGPH